MSGTQTKGNNVEIITIGNTVMKAKDSNGKTIVRIHAMQSGLWALSCDGEYNEMAEGEAKRAFNARIIAIVLGE